MTSIVLLVLFIAGCAKPSAPVCIPVTTNVTTRTETTVTIGYAAIDDLVRGGELLLSVRAPDTAAVQMLPGVRLYTAGESIALGKYTGLRHVTLPTDRLRIIPAGEHRLPTEMCLRRDAQVVSPETVEMVTVYEEAQ